MIDIPVIDRPSFILFPFNNTRTAWRPIGFPIVLVVPFGLFPDGSNRNEGSIFFSEQNALQISIEGAPERARVVGHNNIGKYSPSTFLYTEYLSYQELYDRQIIPSLYPYYDSNGLPTDDYDKARYFEYTTGSGVTELLQILPEATYYDLSEIALPTQDLPYGDYFLTYDTNFYIRQIVDGQLACIDTNSIGYAVARILISHPGDVMLEFFNLTPEPYLTTAEKSKDTTIGIYRPFTDILQDVFDEQQYLESINWVYECPPQIIPYLSTMLGWDIPYFPASLDNLRKALLRRTVELQNLKGSSKALTELFRLFGFSIFIDQLWYSTDGQRLIAPNEKLPSPYTDQQITSDEEYYTDIAYYDVSQTGFITNEVPLLYKPQVLRDLPIISATLPAPITIYGIITEDQQSIELLKQILSSEINDYQQYPGGYVLPTAVAEADLVYSGLSILLVDDKDQITSIAQNGLRTPLTTSSIIVSRNDNKIAYKINSSLYDTEKMFVFAVYNRIIYNIPESITNLHSNRFNIKIFNEADESVDQTTLDFLLEFLYRLKAFHSLLYSVQNVVNLNESYLVTDLCVGGDFYQRFGTDLGIQQVPPAIIPSASEVCSTPTQYGYKDTDLRYRKELYDSLINEFEIAKSYDDRQYLPFDTLIPPPVPANSGSCLYTPDNQDRIVPGSKIDEYSIKFDPNAFYNQLIGGINRYQWAPNKDGDLNESTNNNSELFKLGEILGTSNGQTFCNLDGVSDHCYKGRVSDELFHSSIVTFEESYVPRPCVISIGTGSYYTYPVVTKINKAGTNRPTSKSLTSKISFTGNAPTGGIDYYSSTINNTPDSSFLGRLTHNYTAINHTLHYSDRTKIFADQFQLLALQRPSLHVDKPIMHIPGCRFPTIANLENDYETQVYDARPWDDPWSTNCGPINVCNRGPSYLNAQILVAEDGNEYLIFDYRDYIAYGNGLPSDLGDLNGNISLIDGPAIIHRVYVVNINSNPAVTFDQCDDISGAILVEDDGYLLQEDGSKITLETADASIITDTPRFNSAILCSDGLYHDDVDGYPSLWGSYTFINEDITRSGLYSEVLEGLGWQTEGQVSKSSRYYLSSGIYVENGWRLDCGCSVYTCEINLTGQTSFTDLTASTSDEPGTTLCDPSKPSDIDEYELISFLSPEDIIDVSDIRLDGTIPSLFELTSLS